MDRDDETRDRLRALSERITDLEQAFSRGIRDGRRSTQVPVAVLEGLPDDWIATTPQSATRSPSPRSTPTRTRS